MTIHDSPYQFKVPYIMYADFEAILEPVEGSTPNPESSYTKVINLGGGGNAIYVPYGDVPPIRVYFLAFESETGCLFFEPDSKTGCQICKINPIQGIQPIHSTVWHPPVGFNLFVFCSGN